MTLNAKLAKGPAAYLVAIVVLLTAAAAPAFADYVRIKGSVVNVRQGPGTSFTTLFQAEKGEEFHLLATEGLWCRVSLSDGREAWIFRRLVEIQPGDLPGLQGADEQQPAEQPATGSHNLLVQILTPLLLLATGGLFVWKRKQVILFAGRKLREISGYRRETPFRYDNRMPDKDKWDI